MIPNHWKQLREEQKQHQGHITDEDREMLEAAVCLPGSLVCSAVNWGPLSFSSEKVQVLSAEQLT